MSVTIISLPWPAKELSPNHRSRTYHAKARATKVARAMAWAETTKAKAQGTLLTVAFCPPDKRARDRDNMIASAKAYQDGIADALSANDHSFNPEYRFANPTKGGRVVVEIGGKA